MTIDYNTEFEELNPSLTRNSSTHNELIKVLHKPIIDQQEDFLWLRDNLTNLNRAVGSHLDIIGRLVGQDRLLVSFNTEPYFGFEGSYQSETLSSVGNPEIGGYWNTFDNFVASTARRLSDDEYRNVIKARIIKNNSKCTINDLVEVVNLLTFTGNCTVTRVKHTQLKITVDDTLGLLTYFSDLRNREGDILPIPYGLSLALEPLQPTPTPTERRVHTSDVVVYGAAGWDAPQWSVYVNDQYIGRYDTQLSSHDSDGAVIPDFIEIRTKGAGSSSPATRYINTSDQPVTIEFDESSIVLEEWYGPLEKVYSRATQTGLTNSRRQFLLESQLFRASTVTALNIPADGFDMWGYPLVNITLDFYDRGTGAFVEKISGTFSGVYTGTIEEELWQKYPQLQMELLYEETLSWSYGSTFAIPENSGEITINGGARPPEANVNLVLKVVSDFPYTISVSSGNVVGIVDERNQRTTCVLTNGNVDDIVLNPYGVYYV